MTLTKMQGVLGLFTLLIIILITNPGFYNNMYNNVLGRVVLIAILIFFATNNVTLGLLVALIIIIGTNMYFIEGLELISGIPTFGSALKDPSQRTKNTELSTTTEMGTDTGTTTNTGSNISDGTDTESNKNGSNIKGTTIGDDGVTPDASITTTKIIVTPNKKLGNDRQSLEETIKAKPSSQIPVARENFTSTEVNAYDGYVLKEGYVSQFGAF